MLRRGLVSRGSALVSQTASVRAFSLSKARSGGHGHDQHEEPAPEEHLANNPKYIAVAGLLAGSLAVLGLDSYYRKLYGQSYFGQMIHPTPAAQVASANVQYQEQLNKSAEVYEALYAQPVKSPFRDAAFVQTIRRGSPFNREPGSSLDIDALGPRREVKRSIFD